MICNRSEEAHLVFKGIVKTATNDGIEWRHHYAYEAIWNECDPKELVEQLNVGSSFEDKTTVCKPNHESPEDEVEKCGIAVKSYEHIVDGYLALAPKLWVDPVGREQKGGEPV